MTPLLAVLNDAAPGLILILVLWLAAERRS
jgi:hypothetical protein